MRVTSMRHLTETSLMGSALHYLGRYVPSVKQLERVLLNRCRRHLREKEGDLEAARALVATVLARLERAGYLDDARLAEAKAASLRRAGRSSRAVALKLRQKGLAAPLVATHARASEEEELQAAWTLARKRRLGPFSRTPMDGEVRTKHLATLARAGFSFDLALRVVDASAPPDSSAEGPWGGR